MRRRMFRLSRLLLALAVAGTAQASQWGNIGPAPIESPSQGDFGSGPVTGRVAEVAVDPSDPDHWLIGGAYGGVWETQNAGVTWSPRTDDAVSLAMGAIAFARSDPRIVYAGTGEAVWYVGSGLLRSTDGGTTWEHIDSADPTFVDTSFSDIQVDPADPTRLLAATAHAKASGRQGGFVNQPTTGIFRSLDGGATWSLQLEGWATDLEVDPSDFRRQYAGLGAAFGHADNGVYRSANGGVDWQRISCRSRPPMM